MKFGSKLKVLSLTICALMVVSAFSLTVFATPTLTVNTPTVTTVNGLVQVTVPYTAADVAQVTLLVVKATSDVTTAPDASEANIAYIDQQASGTGTFTFKVDPTALGTSTKLFIKVGGTAIDNPASTAIDYQLPALDVSDYNGVDGVTAADVTLLLRRSVGDNSAFPNTNAIEDLNGVDGVTAADVTLVLRRSVGDAAKYPCEQ